MQRESGRIGTPEEWLNRARSNLAIAKQPKPAEVVWEDLCFDAQQAAEKAIKAVLVSKKIEFPKTHNIRALLNILHQSGLEIPDYILKARRLSNYAVETRYPGDEEPVTEQEYREAVSIAESVLHWAEKIIFGDMS